MYVWLFHLKMTWVSGCCYILYLIKWKEPWTYNERIRFDFQLHHLDSHLWQISLIKVCFFIYKMVFIIAILSIYCEDLTRQHMGEICHRWLEHCSPSKILISFPFPWLNLNTNNENYYLFNWIIFHLQGL